MSLFGSTTPSDPARSTYQAELPPATGHEPNLYCEDNASKLHVSISDDTVQSSATSSATADAATTLKTESLLLSSNAGREPKRHPVAKRRLSAHEILSVFEGETRIAREASEYDRRQAVHPPRNDSFQRPLLVIDGRADRLLQAETARVATSTITSSLLTHFAHLSDDLSNTHTTFRRRWIFTLRCSTAEWRINTNPISHRWWAQTHRDRSDQAWRPRAEKNWAWILGRIRNKYWKDQEEAISKILSPRIWMNLEKSVPRCPTSSHRCIPIVTQRRALQTRILKMENYEKCCLHHRFCKLLHCYRRGARAKRTQAGLRKSLMSGSSQEPRAPGKPAAMFSLGSEERWNQFKSSVFKHADPSNLRRSLLERYLDHLLSLARSEPMKQEHQVESLKNCISELQQQTYAQRLELQDAQHGCIESSRWGLSAEIKRKSWDNTKAHFSVAGNARSDEFYQWFRRISRSGIKLQWKIVLRFHSTCNDSTFSFDAELRQTLAAWHMEYIWITGKLFW